MLRRAKMFLGVGLLTACASGLSGGFGSGLHAYDGSALGARILEPGHGIVRFALTEPAYVAIFEVVPGSGSTLIFPANHADSRRMFRAGVHSGLVSPFIDGRHAYTNLAYTNLAYTNLSFRRSNEPTYLFLIASDSPLAIAPYIGSVSTLRSAMGYSTFTSINSSAAFSAIQSLVIRNPETTEWTTDVYTIWPIQHGGLAYRRAITCTDGRTIIVSGNYIPVNCLRDTKKTKPPRDTTKQVVEKGKKGGPTGFAPRGDKPSRGAPNVESGVVRQPKPTARPEGSVARQPERMPKAETRVTREVHRAPKTESTVARQVDQTPRAAPAAVQRSTKAAPAPANSARAAESPRGNKVK